MVEANERRSALAGVTAGGVFGAADGGPGLIIAERRGLAILHLAARSGDADFAAAVEAAAGAPPPKVPNTAAETNRATVLWLAPDRWLLVAPGDDPGGLEETLRARAPGCAVVDVSHGRTVLRLHGSAVRAVLAKGCPVDLHSRVFGPGHCAQSHLGPVNGLVHALGGGKAIDVYVARGLAVSFWEWLTEAAAEYGYVTEAM